MAYDIKFRKRTIEYKKEGHSIEQTSKTFGIGTTTVKRWLQKSKEGDLSDSKPNRTFKKIDPEKLKEYVKQHPDAYQYEMAEHFNCSPKAIWQALRKHGITRKKR